MNLLLLFFIAFSISIRAEVLACREQADLYGDGIKARYFSPDCISEALSSRGENNFYQSADRKLSIIGHQNFIMISSTVGERFTAMPLPKYEFIAGNKTGLIDIESLEYDETEKVITVVNRSKKSEMLQFSIEDSGNISPKKKPSSEQVDMDPHRPGQ